MLLQSLSALCLAPGGSGSLWKYLEALLRSPRVSGRIGCGFRTEFHFADELERMILYLSEDDFILSSVFIYSVPLLELHWRALETALSKCISTSSYVQAVGKHLDASGRIRVTVQNGGIMESWLSNNFTSCWCLLMMIEFDSSAVGTLQGFQKFIWHTVILDRILYLLPHLHSQGILVCHRFTVIISNEHMKLCILQW